MFRDLLLRFLKEKVLNNLIDVEVETRNGMLKSFLYALDIILEKFGQNGKILIFETNFLNAGILLAKDSHKFIDVSENELIFVFTDKRFFLKGTIKVVSPRAHLKKTSQFIEQLKPVILTP